MIEMLALGSVSVAPNAWPFSMARAQTRLTIDPTLAFRLLIVLPQIVAGLAFPIKQADTVQSVWGFVNYQAQYVPSPVPIYWWSFWNTSTFLSTAREWRKGIRSRVFQDETRVWLYDVVETGLERCVFDGSSVIAFYWFIRVAGSEIGMQVPACSNVSVRYPNAPLCTTAFLARY